MFTFLAQITYLEILPYASDQGNEIDLINKNCVEHTIKSGFLVQHYKKHCLRHEISFACVSIVHKTQ